MWPLARFACALKGVPSYLKGKRLSPIVARSDTAPKRIKISKKLRNKMAGRIKVDRKIKSEATIQADLYIALKARGLNVILEQPIPLAGWGTRFNKSGKIRVDILVMDGDNYAVCAIEMKNKQGYIPPDGSRQLRKYQALGIPFRYCSGYDEFDDVVNWACGFIAIK